MGAPGRMGHMGHLSRLPIEIPASAQAGTPAGLVNRFLKKLLPFVSADHLELSLLQKYNLSFLSLSSASHLFPLSIDPSTTSNPLIRNLQNGECYSGPSDRAPITLGKLRGLETFIDTVDPSNPSRYKHLGESCLQYSNSLPPSDPSSPSSPSWTVSWSSASRPRPRPPPASSCLSRASRS